MATVLKPSVRITQTDWLSGTPRVHELDRWIYVYMAASFVAVTLVGFIPDSLDKVAAVHAGTRPPFPIVLHLHAVLMGSFLLLLLTQTWLSASGRIAWHMRLGVLAAIIVPALVVVGFVLIPTLYRQIFEAYQTAAPTARAKLHALLATKENALLIQFRMGLLFPLFLGIGLAARRSDPGLHKRMMILGTAVVLPPAIDRITWMPGTLPGSFLSADLYTLLLISPMLVWDVVRNGKLHRAYQLWLALMLPSAVAMYALCNTPWWHMTARRLILG